MIHWHDLPIALSPTPGPEHDCFSGQALVEDNRVILMYHGTQAGNCIATADDPLLCNWQKHPNNPVIPIVPIDEHGEPYRVFDPCLWKVGDWYHCASGTFKDGQKFSDCKPIIYQFRSRDLCQWERVAPLLSDNAFMEWGEDAAVPNFLPISDDRHLLLFFSHKRASQYFLGHYDTKSFRFTPMKHGRLNHGPAVKGSLHAPSATIDPDGRLLAIYNVKQGKPTQTWLGLMTLPHVLSLGDDQALRVKPVDAIQSLRFDPVALPAQTIPANQYVKLDAIRGKSLELQAQIDLGQAREVGFEVFRSPDGQERTRISIYRNAYDRLGPNTHALQIDTSEASLRPDVWGRPPETATFHLDENEIVNLRIFIDRSIVEVFVNDRQCLTQRAYPQRPDSNDIAIFARGNEAKLLNGQAWQMRSIWPELKTHEGT